ncbi:hypothetical protein METP3_01282 [Methanosarcinales archaeon]|nr:hypothetical protein METP3_01282 [Methanosarcinales archaeon]
MGLDQRNLEEEYSKLLACRSEAKRLVENMNALLPESDRFSADRREEPLGDLIKDARNKAIRAVLRPQFESSNVNIDVDEISKALDKNAPRYFTVYKVMAIFRSKYDTAKDELKAQFLKEADLLLPYRGINSPEDMVKGKSLVLRHSVTESKYGGSPDGIWDFRTRVTSLEKLIRIQLQNADPRVVHGGLIANLYNRQDNPWDKFAITDPVLVSSKLYKNGKFELEFTSGEMARKMAAVLFMSQKRG